MAQLSQKPVVQDFSKGMNAVTNPYDLGDKQSMSLVNLLMDEHGSLRTRDGSVIETSSPDAAPGIIRPIIRIFDYVTPLSVSPGGGSDSGGGGPVTPPAITILSPLNGAVVSGTILITVSVSSGVTVVQYFSIGQAISGTISAAPFSFNYDTTAIPLADVDIYAIATDAQGNQIRSASVNITINNGGGGGGPTP